MWCAVGRSAFVHFEVMATTTPTELSAEIVAELVAALQPICRSITGNGVRQSLRLIADALATHAASTRFVMSEIPTGTPILDWTVPNEWNITDAYVGNSNGDRLIDFQASALHVLNYSEPINQRMTFAELQPHLFSLPDRPQWIPYRTSYHNPAWGFCVAHDQLAEIEAAPGPLHVVIDSTLKPGSLTYGEITIPGMAHGTPQDRSVILSTHICHPAMANDNITGMVALTQLATVFAQQTLRHTVRLLFVPGTIGAIAWLAQNQETIPTIDGGLVITGLGDHRPLTYKSSRRTNTLFDRTVHSTLAAVAPGYESMAWEPYGYDERQFCSPGIDLAVGRLTRSVHGRYPEYHTSADNLSFVNFDQVQTAVDAVHAIITNFDSIDAPRIINGMGEPQLGRRGLYSQTGGAIDHRSVEMAYLWVLSLSDGEHSVADIANESGLATDVIKAALERLRDAELIHQRVS
jgi:aminopeptidase-like protein